MNNDAGKISFESGLDLTGLDRDIKTAQDRFRELNGNVQKECTGIDGSIRNIGASIAAVFTVQKAGEFIKKMVAVRGEIESLEKSFGILAGTVQGKKLFEDIKDFAVKTPMTMPALAKGAQTLLAFNYEAENVMPILRAIGDISMGNEQKFNSLVLAFSQMSSTGKLMGQDLLQMINAGFNPLAVISEQTGKSIGELKEEMAAGAISSEMITKAFMDATSEGGKFNGMLEQQSKGIEGSLSNLEGTIQDMFNELGEKSQGVITSSIQNVTALVQNYEKVGRVIAGLIAIYGTYRAALITLNAIKKASIAINSGWTASELLHYKALVIVEKAQKLLNATMLKNPYVLVATAVVSLAAMVWALRDSLSAAEKAQKKYNETKEEALQKEKEHSDAIQGLIDKVRDETAVMAERETALMSLKNEYPDIFNKYDIEKLKLADLLEIKKQINQEDYKRKRAAAKQEYLDFNKNIHWDTKGNNNSLSKLRDEQVATRNLMREDYTKDSVAEFITTLKNKSQEELDNILQTASGASEGLNGFQLDDNMNVIKDRLVNSSNLDKVSIEGDNLTTIIDAINKEISYRNPINTPTYAADYEKARKEWETAKKELQAIEKDKDNFTTKQYEDAKSREENAKKRYSELGGDVSEKTKSTSEDRTAEEMKNAARERMALEKNLYFQEQQNRINLETDERKRRNEQMALDHEKELYNLEQQKQSTIETEIERQKAIFEAVENTKASKDNKYVKKTFSEAEINKTEIDKIKKSYETLYTQVQSIQQKERDEIKNEEEKAQNEYFSKYGTYLERIEAITKLYSEKIRKAATEGERKTLEAERDNAIKSIEQEMNGNGINWDNIFADVSHRSVESLKEMRNEIRKVIIEGKDLSASDISRLYEQYNKVGEAIEESSFSLKKMIGYTNEDVEYANRLKEEYEELKSIYEELVELQNQHRTEAELANQNLVDFMQEHAGQNVTGNESEQTMIEMLQGNNATEDTMSAFNDLFSKNKEASAQLVATTQNVQGAGEAMGKAGAAMQGAGGSAASTIAIIDKIIHTVNDNVQSAVGVMEELGLEDTKAGKFTEKFAESSQYATQAWESLKSGNIMGVVQGVLGSLRTLGEGLGQLGIAGFGSNNADLPEQLENLTHSNENLQRSIDYLSEKIEEANNADAKELYEQQKKDLLNAISGTQDMMDTAGSTYSNGFLGIGGSHSADYFINENLSSTDWARMNQILKENGFDSTVNQAGDLWFLSPEEMEALATSAPDLWTKLQDAISEGYAGEELNQLLNDYLDFAGQMEEYSEQFVEKITNVSFDELSDEFKSFITNADMTATEFANDFNKKLVDAIAESLMTQKYNARIKALQEQWTKYMEDGVLTDEERAALEAERDKITEEMLADREGIEDMFGDYSSQDSTKKGFQAMSQESADELSGRFTAIQIDTSNIKSLCDSILINTQFIANATIAMRQNSDEIKNLSLLALDCLESISRNTYELYEMNDRLGKIEQNTRNL